MIRLCRRFLGARDGNFGMIAAIAMFPLGLTTLGVVDLTIYRSSLTTVQDSMDAAALAAAKDIDDGVDKAKDLAQKVFASNIKTDKLRGTAVLTFLGVEEDADGASVLKFRSDYRHNFYFSGALNLIAKLAGSKSTLQEFLDTQLTTQVAFGEMAMEVAFVLDNSGSMNDGGKIATLRSVAEDSVKKLFTLADVSKGDIVDPIKVALVPFAASVNVGTGNRSASWMDPGNSDSTLQGNDWSTSSYAVSQNPSTKLWTRNSDKTVLNRFYLYDQMRVAWGGCVEVRRGSYGTDDTAPKASDPNSYFTPMFAPDQPSYYSRYPSNNRSTDETSAYSSFDYLDDLRKISSNSQKDNYIGYSKQFARQGRVDKYEYYPSNSGVTANGLSNGPNYMCTTQPVMPLTTDKSKAINNVRSMVASGGTNIPDGVAWGWRTLSHGEPFTEGRGPGDRDYNRTKKIMIVMTDGENTYYNYNFRTSVSSSDPNQNRSTYGAYGFASTGEIFKGTSKQGTTQYTSDNYTTAMNERLTTVCTNAKAAGIEIYTVAFDVDDPSTVKNILYNCASDDKGGHFFDAKTSANLIASFDQIINNISEIRLVR